MSAQQIHGTTENRVIPTPEITIVQDHYEKLYKTDWKCPKQYIHLQAWGVDQEEIDYDMDEKDETWLKNEVRKFDLTSDKFERMMDRLENASGQVVVSLNEAKMLLKEDDELTIAVYDYWLSKRLAVQAQTLIAKVKTDKRDGTSSSDPYVAFRRRTEKMQTRKNRKNDEASFEKMNKLRRDIKKALTIIDLVKRREKSKKELLEYTKEVFEKRFFCEDYSGELVAEAKKQRVEKRPMFNLTQSYQWPISWQNAWNEEAAQAPARKKRKYEKKRRINHHSAERLPQYNDYDDYVASEEESVSSEEEEEVDGTFSFRRKPGSKYLAPVYEPCERFAWTAPEDGGVGDERFRFSLVSFDKPKRHCVGYVRRRIGRGGRVVFDRARTPWDQICRNKDIGNDLKFHFSNCEHRNVPAASVSTVSSFKTHKDDLIKAESASREKQINNSIVKDCNESDNRLTPIDKDTVRNTIARLSVQNSRTAALKINLNKKAPAELVEPTNCIF